MCHTPSICPKNDDVRVINKTGRILFKTQRSFSVPTAKETKTTEETEPKNRSARVSVSNENNVLLDPEVLTDFSTQTLVLTVLVTLVKNSSDENEQRILYEYLAEASVVFPKVFPVIHNLLDAKINSVLCSCHDQGILNSVQAIIQNMISSEDTSQQQLHYLQSCGFGGLWRFAGPYTNSNCTAKSAQLFVNCLEAMIKTCLPVDETEGSSSNETSMEKSKRMESHQSDVASKSKTSVYWTDRTSAHNSSDPTDETCRSSTSFIHRDHVIDRRGDISLDPINQGENSSSSSQA